MAIRVAVRGGVLYLRGVVSVEIAGKTAQRTIYRSLRRAAVAPGARKWAERRAAQYESALYRRLERELLEGPKPEWVTWRRAYVEYRQAREDRLAAANPAHRGDIFDLDIDTAWKMTVFFDSRGVADQRLPVPAHVVNEYFRVHHVSRGHKLSTMVRANSVYCAVMNMQVRAGRIAAGFPKPTLPKFDPVAAPVNKWLYPDEIRLFIRLASPHFRPLLATLFGTGRRGGELPHLPIDALDLTPGREHLFIGRTKNGLPVIAPLPDWTVRTLRAWLRYRRIKYRGQYQHPVLFLTDKGDPYAKPRRQRGTIFRTAWHQTRKRVAEVLAKAGKPERAAIIMRATPHWGRHNAASHLIMAGHDPVTVARHMGWLSPKMVHRYAHLSPERSKELANTLDFGAKTVQQKKA